MDCSTLKQENVRPANVNLDMTDGSCQEKETTQIGSSFQAVALALIAGCGKLRGDRTCHLLSPPLGSV
jgi:hypothetical protein